LEGERAFAVWRDLYASRVGHREDFSGRRRAEAASWHIVGAWLLGVATEALSRTANLFDAERWFLGNTFSRGLATCVSQKALSDAEETLHSIGDSDALRDLLPYVLDPHGEGSRLSVRLRPETAQARQRKRREGVFYTPADVATFMAKEALKDLDDEALPLTVFDPACGTGVFLDAVLPELQRRMPSVDSFDLACSCLYGTDIDPWAISAAAFVILQACYPAVRSRGIPPIAAWHALRLNFAQLNALQLDPGDPVLDDRKRTLRLECRARLKSGEIPGRVETALGPGPFPITRVFAEIGLGPRVIIGNPPYASVGAENDLSFVSKRLSTLRANPRPAANIYPLFAEQMIRLAAPDAHGGAMVLPLSVACNTGAQFVALRTLISSTPGKWRFAFFDREPHALFGEDVKTRNGIVLWTKHANESAVQVSTGPLRRWHGHSRARMFSTISFTPIDVDIRLGIPKIEGAAQSAALSHLLQTPDRHTLQHSVTGLSRATLVDSFASNGTIVHVGATAYNFLNVFLRPPSQFADLPRLTEHPLHAIKCTSPNNAICVFAILSSRLAFWWWHVSGDGFHVSRRALETIPIGSVLDSKREADALRECGEQLWDLVRREPIVSRNRDRTSLGFSSVPHAKIRTKIDALLVGALGLDSEFTNRLEHFTNSIRTAGMQIEAQTV
jgi:hypothetical protein